MSDTTQNTTTITMVCASCRTWSDPEHPYDGELEFSVLSIERRYYPSVDMLCPRCTRRVEAYIEKGCPDE